MLKEIYNHHFTTSSHSTKTKNTTYISTILQKSEKYLKTEFSPKEYKEFLRRIETIKSLDSTKEIIKEFEKQYYAFVKELYQRSYAYNKELDEFVESKSDKKIIWGDCLKALKMMKSESISCMVTSPPYYNAREYAQYKNLNEYLENMKEIIKECWRVLDNHRVFVFNVGDIFDNDNLYTRLLLGVKDDCL